MGLQPGTRIGRYEILARVGVGGMGEVYRARDERLQRDVAVKVLPQSVSLDPDRLARFEREARLLASLNHAAIAHIHGLEEVDDLRALVMEFVDGPTLADRIAQGPLAIGEALPIALQIADAALSAHTHGIVHRDLKPANIKIARDGSVKVLDFGLAKAIDTGDLRVDATLSPTITSPAALTAHGTVLGTAAYMSPEQARGVMVDKRADIWAFGCVLFEMLAARRAFPGDTVADALAHVLRSDPDWTALPGDTPPAIRRLLRRCLEKDPKRRLHDFADVRLEILDAIEMRRDEGAQSAPLPAARAGGTFVLVAIAVAVVAAAATAAILLSLQRTAPARELRVEIATPASSDIASFALSPDGASIAYIAAENGRRRLWLRSLESGAVKELAGTDGASLPFWAPNGNAIGFFADDGRLKRVEVEGGTVRALATAPLPWGATWNVDDTILFAPVTGSIFRLPASGGKPAAITKLAPSQSNHSFPWALPDGRHFIYYVSGGPDVRGVYAATLDGRENRRLVDADGIAGATAGHLLFVRDTTLFAQPVDFARLEVTGAAQAIVEKLALQPAAGSLLAAVSASPAGRIAFRTGAGVSQRQFVWFDRTGRELEKIGEPDNGNPLSPNLSKDGRFIAVHRTIGGNVDLWLVDTVRGVRRRLTSHPANDIHPLWAPDGRSLLFSSNRTGGYQLYSMAIGTEGDEKLLLPFQSPATDWSPDGRTVLIQRRDVTGSADIWAFPLGPDGQPRPVVQSADFEERDGQFSPDGKWIAYQSTESGRWEIYVQPFPGPGAKVPVSSNGGAQARWRADGRELFFIGLDERLMAVPIETIGVTAQVGVPVPLFRTHVGGAVQGSSRQQYFVSGDGHRFLMNTVLDGGPSSPITLVVNWNPKRDRQ